MIDICTKIQSHIPPNAVFIQPFDNTELKFYGQRSSYVEFKANVKNPSQAAEWYRRIKEVYHTDAESKEKGFTLQQSADAYFNHLSDSTLQKLQMEGVTHVLINKKFSVAGGKEVLRNSSYAVYQL
jgi:hypothetical protein